MSDKENAVAVYEQGDLTYRQLGQELGVSKETLSKWVLQFRKEKADINECELEESKALRKENKRLLLCPSLKISKNIHSSCYKI